MSRIAKPDCGANMGVVGCLQATLNWLHCRLPQRRIQLLALFIFALSSASAQDCEGDFVSDVERQACYDRLAQDSGDYRKCFGAPLVDGCVINLAVETRNPKPIFDLTREGGASVYGPQDRDWLLYSYIRLSNDFSPLGEIQDNRMHDNTLMKSLESAYARTGYAPKTTYCDRMRGGYAYDDSINVNIPLESEIIAEKNRCQAYVAAIRQMKYGNNECGGQLPARITMINGNERERATDECQSLVDYVRRGMKERVGDAWLLARTEINPRKEPTHFEVGVTPNYFSSPRFDGKYEIYTVSEEAITYATRDVDGGTEYHKAEFTAALSKPPKMIFPGENITLTASVSGSGSSKDDAGGCSAALRFEYRVAGAKLSGETKYTICLDFKPKTITSQFTAPKTHGGELAVDAFLWNCGACNVRWVYKEYGGEMPEIDPGDYVDDESFTGLFEKPEKATTTTQQDKPGGPKGTGLTGRIIGLGRSIAGKIMSWLQV